MKLSYTKYRIQCTHPFGISRSSHDHYDIVYIYLEHDGIIGRGEAAPSGRYDEFTDDITEILDKGINLPQEIDDPEVFSKHIFNQCNGIKSLEVAFSMAILDLWCQQNNYPLYEYLNADPMQAPHTSYTISIGDIDLISEKVNEGAPYSILKVKLGMGVDKDKEIMNKFRKMDTHMDTHS